MSQIKPQVSKTSNAKKSTPTKLDRFEQFCRIVNQYLRWPIQLIAILCCYVFMNPEVAWRASVCILAVGNASTIKRLIDKISGPS